MKVNEYDNKMFLLQIMVQFYPLLFVVLFNYLSI